MRETPLEILTCSERIANASLPEHIKVSALYYIIKEACYKDKLDGALQEARDQYYSCQVQEARLRAGGGSK